MVKILKNYINGNWIESKTENYTEVRNPATDEVLAKVPMSTKEEVDITVDAANNAFHREWRNASINDRLDPLYKFVQVLKKNQENLAEIVTLEHGKEYPSALGEIKRMIQMVQGACTAMEIQKGDFSENVAAGIDEYSVMRPIGVFAMIPPFNFPAMVPWWYAPYAIAVGDSYIIKANEHCPMAQQEIFKLINEELELPAGVINLINGGTEVGNWLIEHPNIEGISFVGSTSVAKRIYKKAATEGKRVQCQAGANNFLVVMPDVNLEKAIPNMMGSCFGNTGQRCLTGSIVVGVGDIYEELKEKFLEAARNLKVGYGLDKGTDVGPVISKEALQRLRQDIQKGLEEGAELILDGRDIEVKKYPSGYFLGPTVFERAEPGMYIFDEEIFGPVTCLTKTENLDEAIEMVNNSRYGNATTIYTESGGLARKFQNEVKVGNVGINVGVVAPMAYYPFSGMKDSFFGELHGQSKDAIYFFADRQVVIRRWYGKIFK